MTDKVILVFARLEYSHSGPELGTGGEGTTTNLVGIATDAGKALSMINADKYKTLVDEDLNPILFDLQNHDIEWNGERYPGVGITIEGTDDGVHWINKVTWYTHQVPLNELLEHFEL